MFYKTSETSHDILELSTTGPYWWRATLGGVASVFLRRREILLPRFLSFKRVIARRVMLTHREIVSGSNSV